MNVSNRKIQPSIVMVIMTTSIKMRMQTRIIPPEPIVVIMTATHAMNVVMAQMRQPMTSFVEMTATYSMPMTNRK